jgi:hypothetical protein
MIFPKSVVIYNVWFEEVKQTMHRRQYKNKEKKKRDESPNISDLLHKHIFMAQY